MTYELVVVGASWGGLSAASTLLKGLPRGLAAAVVIAQHRGVDVTGGGLAQLLDSRAFMPLKDVEDKEPLERGHIYLAPSDYHVLVERGHLSLSVEGPVSFSRPSIDVLFESAADAYRERTIGVILTGANADGALGLKRIRDKGGLALVQDPATAERPEMPAAAIETGAVHRVLALEEIAPLLVELCGVDDREAKAG